MKTIYLIIVMLITLNLSVLAQDDSYDVQGKVMDVTGEELVGVTIYIKNEPGAGVSTNIDGEFIIKNVPKNAVIVFSYIGFKDHELLVAKSLYKQKIVLEESADQIQELIVVGHGSQRKVSVVGAVTTVKPKDLISPSTSITNMLGGRVPGIIAVTRSGEPGDDFSEFWIRGISTFGASSSALVLIDGVEGNLNDLDPSDIASFSILKDASATAVYGVRGANGVVLVETHKGEAGKMTIIAKSSITFSHSAEMPRYARAYDYSRLANEARAVRGEELVYDETDLSMFKYGLDTDIFPDVDWRDVILKDNTWYNQHYFSASGGGSMARYFLSAGLTNKAAIYNTDEDANAYDTNLSWNKYTFRANVSANLTKTTVLTLGLDGTISKGNSPGNSDTGALWAAQANLTPGLIPLKYSNGMIPAYGSDGSQQSPYITLNHTGFAKNQSNSMRINFGATQDLSGLLEGLSARALFSYQSNASYDVIRAKTPEAFLATGRYADGTLITKRTVEPEPLSYSSSNSNDRQYFFETQLSYERVMEKHRVYGMAHYYMQDYQTSDADDEVASIPKRYQAISGRLTYSYDDTYFVEGNVGYTGSENFATGAQFGIFPSVAAGWIPTAYPFMKENLPFLAHLKFRASYGEVGNDQIGGRRFAYQTYINTGATGGGGWGTGLTEGQIGANNLRWEVAKKYNFGIDATLFGNKIELVVDFFKDIRQDIFQERAQMPEEVGAVNRPYTNVGSMRSSGVDGHIAFNHQINSDMSFTLRANATFAKNKVTHWDQSIVKYPYESHSNVPYSVSRGLIAMGLFADSTEILSAPRQTYGAVRPGDIRYKDINSDGVINDDDIVPLSYSSVPEFQYGFAGEFRYKNWAFGALIEGVGKVEYFLGGNGYYPFVNGSQGNILTSVADDGNRWTPGWYSGDESTENPNARFPRLQYGEVGQGSNNPRNSTFWLADGSYVRLKNIDVSYRWESEFFTRIGLRHMTLQAVAHNLMCWDSIDGVDAGQASSNGAVYPLQRTFTLQVTVGF